MQHVNKALDFSEVDVAFQGHRHFPFPEVEAMDLSDSVSRRQVGRPKKRHELELQDGEQADTPEKVPNKPTQLDANVYATKKSVAQGMLDVALLTANASQLKYLLQVGDEHQFYHLMLILISLSIILQMCVGIVILVKSRYSINEESQQGIAERLNNAIVWLIFASTILNCFLSVFGISPVRKSNSPTTTPPPPE